MTAFTLSMRRLPAALLLSATILPMGLAQAGGSGGVMTVTCTYVMAAVGADSPKDGTLMLLRLEGKTGADCAFMPGATVVDVMASDFDPLRNKSTFSGRTIFYTDKDTVVQAFTGSFDWNANTGAGKATILSGRGAMAGIRGSVTFTLKGIDEERTTATETFTYSVNP